METISLLISCVITVLVGTSGILMIFSKDPDDFAIRHLIWIGISILWVVVLICGGVEYVYTCIQRLQ